MNESLLRFLIAWFVPAAAFLSLWRLLARRQALFIVVAVLCFTPMFVSYPGMGYVDIFPLVIALPAYIVGIPESLKGILSMGVPGGAVVALLAWLVLRRIEGRGGVE